MEPLHPIVPFQDAFKAVFLVLIAVILAQGILGHWNAILATTQEYLVHGVMGLWGE